MRGPGSIVEPVGKISDSLTEQFDFDAPLNRRRRERHTGERGGACDHGARLRPLRQCGRGEGGGAVGERICALNSSSPRDI